MIWVLRVRRMERKLGRQATEQERAEIRRRTRVIAAFIVIAFAYFFNQVLLRR